MNVDSAGFAFPFRVDAGGRMAVSGGDDRLRGKIIQVLFTAPGERVHKPEFGCGLFNLVFEPNDAVLGAAVQFNITQALVRWLKDELRVDGVSVSNADDRILVEIAYTKLEDRTRQALRIQFR